MHEQLVYTTFDPTIPELLARIRNVAKSSKGPQLERDLESLLHDEFEGISGLQQRIADDLRLNDFMLEQLTEALAGTFIKGPRKREYNVISKCAPCASSSRKQRKNNSKHIQLLPASTYIRDADFQEGLLTESLAEKGYIHTCPTCSSELTPTNTSNMILPAKPGALFAIATRVKSAGRYVQKLVDMIFYDKDNPRMKKRDLVDRYAFAIVTNYPDGHNEKEFQRLFKRQLGIHVTGRRPFEDEVCYSIYNLLCRDFEVDQRKLQDNLRDPKVRVANGKVEEYKILQFPLKFHGRLFEGQIKSKDTFLRERDRKSLIYHANYVEIEEEKRQELWREMPEARIVYLKLMQIFSNGN